MKVMALEWLAFKPSHSIEWFGHAIHLNWLYLIGNLAVKNGRIPGLTSLITSSSSLTENSAY